MNDMVGVIKCCQCDFDSCIYSGTFMYCEKHYKEKYPEHKDVPLGNQPLIIANGYSFPLQVSKEGALFVEGLDQWLDICKRIDSEVMKNMGMLMVEDSKTHHVYAIKRIYPRER